MSTITTKFVTDHKLTNEMSLEELSQYAPEILELLTTEGGSEAGEVNICQVSFDNTCSDEIIKETAQRIVWDNLSERDVKAISRTLVKTASNPVVGLSCLSRLRRELRTLNASEKIISATKIPEITKESNKIQKERSEQRKNKGINFPDHFLLESVKKRLDEYNISNMPDKQALANVMIMLCICPAEIKNLRIFNGNEERARQLLTWIQEAISSRQLQDPGKPGSTYLSTFLKKDEFISETESRKHLLPSSLRKLGSVFASVAHGSKNPSKANTYATRVELTNDQKHSSDIIMTHDSGVEHPIIIENIIKHMIPNEQEDIRYIKKLDDYNFEYISLKRTVKRLEKYVKFLESELDILDECVDRETVIDLIHEIVLSLISKRGLKRNRNFSYTIETDTSEESDSGEIVEESHGY
ncbi:hypothetical protein GLOIN_2v1798501 [Rhizophagus clarus]|uniref:Uncharacterized protein n=1 Tax=Rhizophagus clarus TaxID=94130 RepID=A0A8H3LBG8_9GLOM|nr:hypothetical protein GLOIN_2v1798501 [Rhizophagus clarus]